jgi:hypothetical protein
MTEGHLSTRLGRTFPVISSQMRSMSFSDAKGRVDLPAFWRLWQIGANLLGESLP